MSNCGKKESGSETPGSGSGFVKSSAYAPVSLNLMGMYLVKEHMNAHYKRIYNVKAAVDTKPPFVMQRSRSRSSGASRTNSRNSRNISRISRNNSRSSSCQSFVKFYTLHQEWTDEARGNVQLMDKIDKYLESVQNDNEANSSCSKLCNYSASISQRVNKDKHSRQSPDLTAKSRNCRMKQHDSSISNSHDTSMRSRATTRSRPFNSRLPKNERLISNAVSPPNKHFDRAIRANHKKRLVPALKIQRDIDHVRWLADQERKLRVEKQLDELELALSSERSTDSLMEYEVNRYYSKNTSDENSESRHRTENVSSNSRKLLDHTSFIHSPQTMRKLYSNRNADWSKTHLGLRPLVKEQLEAEEEELKYLEFITEVTDDILLRGVYTDRALKQVFQYHMNRRNDLEFTKMKNLLGKLQDDLGIPRFGTQFALPQGLSNAESSLLSNATTSKWEETLNEAEISNRSNKSRSNSSINLDDKKTLVYFSPTLEKIEGEKGRKDVNNTRINDVDDFTNENALVEEIGNDVSQNLNELRLSDRDEDLNIASDEETDSSSNKSSKSHSFENTDREVESLMNYSNEDFYSSPSESDS